MVAAAGAAGAAARFLVDTWVSEATVDRFPWGTLAVNLTGSLVLGLITGLVVYHHLARLPDDVLGEGFCGAYTTFSTFSYETVRLVEDGALGAAARNVAMSVAGGLAAAAAGLAAGAAI